MLLPLGNLHANAFFLSVGMVGIAEIFDKTWFVALVMAMRHEKNTVFWGCYAALLVHVLVAAAFGYSVARMLSPRMLDFLAAGLYGAFAALYTYDWATTEKGSDLMAAGKDEVTSSIQEEGQAEEANYGTVKNPQCAPANSKTGSTFRIFCQCFTAVFIAEWGDRTQIAMIGIHASQPLLPVMLGSGLAFGLLTLSAVLVGTFLGDRTLNERTVKALCALSFAFFMCVSIYQGTQIHAPSATTPLPP